MQFLKFRKYNTKKTILFSVVFFSLFLCFSPSVKAQKKYVIVLDAGHGGKDGGASRGKYIEKKIALKLALKVGKLLSREKDIKVVYTRKKDVFIELHKRATIANDNNADLFVSIHCNANNSPKPFGAETYVLGLNGNKTNLEIVKKENEVILLEDNYKQNYDYDPNSPESVIGLSVLQEENLDASLTFASLTQTNFSELKRHNRSVKQANFLVLRETAMPSVLIELGFLSNDAEGKFLNSERGQTKMANAIADAIIVYIGQLEINTIRQRVTTNNPIKESKPEKTIKKAPASAKTSKKVVTNKKPTPQNSIPKSSKTTKTSTTKTTVVEKKETKKLPHQPIKTKKPVTPYIEFKVQVAASKAYISEEPRNFKGLENIEMMIIDEYYKYYYGSSSNFTTVKEYLKDAKKAGVKGAFVVAFENGVKIPLREAIKKQ